MSKRNFIKPFIAAALLLLFAVSSSPRSWLHNLFAKHKDSYGFISTDARTSVSAQHINCQCDSIVVHEPYVLADLAMIPASLSYPIQHGFSFNEPALPTRLVFIDLRGPPSLS